MRPTTLVLVIALLPVLVAQPARAGQLPTETTAPSTRESLSLDDLLAELADRNPRLRAAVAMADATASRVAEASTLPDPMLQIGVMNFGLPDLDTNMPNSMAPSVQLVQSLPFPGKLGLRGEVAGADHAMVEAGAAETWWEIRAAAADLFYDLYALDRALEVRERTFALLGDFQGIAEAMYASGGGNQADVLRADVEVARMDGEIVRLRARRRSVTARLNGLLDRPAGSPVASPGVPALPLDVPSGDTLEGWARGTRPVIERARLGVGRATAQRELAHRDIWPDVSLGLSYGQRSTDGATRRMGSAMIGFSLPIHASSRQLAAREEADAVRRMAEAEFDATLAEVDARIGEELSELDRAGSLMELYRTEVLPQARVTVESALSSYRVGAVDFTTLVDAQLAVNRFEEDFHRLVADYGAAVARLESVVGRRVPASGGLVTTTPEER